MSSARWPTAATLVLLYLGALLWLALIKAPTLHEPHYWDALGSYMFQVRFLAEHGFDREAYRKLGYVRPPLITGLGAWLYAHGAGSRVALRIVIWLLGALIPPATWVIARALGGTRRSAALAFALIALAPTFVAQAGLWQMDLPVTALATVAWALLLRGHRIAFMICATLAVLTKEVGYFLCVPAFVLLLLRAWPAASPMQTSLRQRAADPLGAAQTPPLALVTTAWRVLRSAWPALIPAAALAVWFGIHLWLVGHLSHPAYQSALGWHRWSDVLLHNWLEGGRILLWPCAALAIRAALFHARQGQRPAPAEALDAVAVVATLAGVLALPILFPGALPRYPLPALPMLCALSAAGVMTLARHRTAVSLGLCTLLVLLWWEPSVHGNPGGHMDGNLSYRKALLAEQQASQALAAAHPKSVLAHFPMYTVITAPPEDGFLPAPLQARIPDARTPLSELCRSDFLVESRHGESLAGTVTRLSQANALSLWQTFGSGDWTIAIYRIHCP